MAISSIEHRSGWYDIFDARGKKAKTISHNIGELLEARSPYIAARALARICGMSESQVLQYKGGFKKISPKNIARINEKLRTFADEISGYTLTGA